MGRRYWSEFRAYLQQEGIQLKAQPIGTGDKERFQSFDIGRRTFFLEACFYEQDPETGDPVIVVRLLMRGKDEPAHFHLLERDSDAIVRELGESPAWRQHPHSNRNLNLVCVVKRGINVTDETDWPNQHALKNSTRSSGHALWHSMPPTESLMAKVKAFLSFGVGREVLIRKLP